MRALGFSNFWHTSPHYGVPERPLLCCVDCVRDTILHPHSESEPQSQQHSQRRALRKYNLLTLRPSINHLSYMAGNFNSRHVSVQSIAHSTYIWINNHTQTQQTDMSIQTFCQMQHELGLWHQGQYLSSLASHNISNIEATVISAQNTFGVSKQCLQCFSLIRQ